MRFFKPLTVLLLLTTTFDSCKKNSDSIDTTPNFYIVNGGTANFDNSLILFGAADTVTYNLVISPTFLLPKDVTITLAVADDLRQAYNSTNGTNYQAMPSTAYSFQTTFTAAASASTYDTIAVILNKQFLSSGNFMLPVKIQTVSDYKIDSTASVIYLHTKDNNLSGVYSSAITKKLYNGDTVTGSLNSTDTSTIIKNLTPISETTSELDYADLGANGWKYELSFDVNGSLSVIANDVINNSVQAGSFAILSSSFDPLTKKIYIKSSYKNSNGDARIVEESLSLH